MSKILTKALQSPEAKALLAAGLKVVSTDRQIANGTIALAGKVRKQPVSYKITLNGAVMSNDFVARRVVGSTDYQVYKAGLAAAGDLFAKRKAA